MPAIAKIRYTHDAVIDMIIANPAVSQNDLAAEFGFSVSWMSIIINSDAFQNRLAERKAILVDPRLAASIEDRLDVLAKRSLDKLLDRIDQNNPISTTDLVRIATLGVGDKNKKPDKPTVQQNLYVVNLPPPAPNAKEWLSSSQGFGQVIENVERA